MNVHAGKRRLLIMDLYSAHRTEAVLNLLKENDIDVLFIPGGCTGLLQLMDVALNKILKKIYSEIWCKFRCVNKLPPTRELITEWVAKALQELPATKTLLPAFKKLVLENVWTETEEGLEKINFVTWYQLTQPKAKVQQVPVAVEDNDGEANAKAMKALFDDAVVEAEPAVLPEPVAVPEPQVAPQPQPEKKRGREEGLIWSCEVCASENQVGKRRKKKKDRQVCATCEQVGPWL